MLAEGYYLSFKSKIYYGRFFKKTLRVHTLNQCSPQTTKIEIQLFFDKGLHCESFTSPFETKRMLEVSDPFSSPDSLKHSVGNSFTAPELLSNASFQCFLVTVAAINLVDNFFACSFET